MRIFRDFPRGTVTFPAQSFVFSMRFRVANAFRVFHAFRVFNAFSRCQCGVVMRPGEARGVARQWRDEAGPKAAGRPTEHPAGEKVRKVRNRCLRS
jgi:hypothetical protein